MADIVLIRGGGDLASGVAIRLFRAGIQLVITEIAQPLAVRRLVSFAEAIYSKQIRIEDVPAQRASSAEECLSLIENGCVPVLVDPEARISALLHPRVMVDGRMTKKPPEYGLDFAPLIVGLGPGFEVGKNCHAIVETKRGPYLGRVFWQGTAEEDSGLPERVGLFQAERVFRAPVDGIFHTVASIGAKVKKGDVVAEVAGQAVSAHFDGMLRGMLHDGLLVHQGVKIGDLDPRLDERLCRTVSDKALAVGGGVLEALLTRPAIRSRLW